MENFEQYLMEKYPNLFYKKEDGSLDCPCGASVPEGWETIIDILCQCIDDHIKLTLKYEKDDQGKVVQVRPPAIFIEQIKEKSGGLRFYYSGGDNEISGMVKYAELLCNKTCEVSGEKGSLHRRGWWYRTLSTSIAENQQNLGFKQCEQKSPDLSRS